MNSRISTKEIIQQTKNLVAIPSTLADQQARTQAISFMADFITAHVPSVTIEYFEQNSVTSFLAYKGNIRPAKFDILLNAHVDVVPGIPTQFTPFEKDGRLYGRGTLDMKGTAMVLASVFSELVNEVPYALGLQIVSDEENSGDDGTYHQVMQGVRANFAIMGEYSNHKATIYNAARGLCWVEIGFSGRAAHGGHPWNGDNAVVRASSFIDTLLRRYPVPAEETWTTTATISSMSTPNDTYNKVPDYAVIKIDFRFTQYDKAFSSEASLRALIAEIDPMAEVITVATLGSVVYVEKENSYVKGLHAAVKDVMGYEPDYHFRPASSDARHFSAIDVPCIEFGLYGHNSHALNEYVEISSFEEYANTMRAFLKNPKV